MKYYSRLDLVLYKNQPKKQNVSKKKHGKKNQTAAADLTYWTIIIYQEVWASLFRCESAQMEAGNSPEIFPEKQQHSYYYKAYKENKTRNIR